MKSRNHVVTFIALATLPILTISCRRTETGEQRVRAAIRRTETQSRQFVYKETLKESVEGGSGGSVGVLGLIQDDYAYKARLFYNGEASLDELATDDSLAVRLLRPEALADLLVAPSQVAAGNVGGDPVLEALNTRHWVKDPLGAPDLTLPGLQTRKIGDDPVLDSLTALSEVERAMALAAAVRVFNPEAIDYQARDDKFPKPESGSGLIRYDLIAPEIQNLTGSTEDRLPDAANFRRMSVYVKNGLIVEVREDIDFATRLRRLSEALNFDLGLEPGETPSPRVVLGAVQLLNRQRVARGIDPIRFRTMSIEFRDVGKPVEITFPTDAIEGSLSILRNRGRGAGAPAATSGSGST